MCVLRWKLKERNFKSLKTPLAKKIVKKMKKNIFSQFIHKFLPKPSKILILQDFKFFVQMEWEVVYKKTNEKNLQEEKSCKIIIQTVKIVKFG